MKRRILALGLFSLCAVALFTGESHAWFGPLNPYNPCSLWNHHNRYVTQITCRPYNAFTPICWGNLVCDGCCPNPCAVAGGCMPMNMGVPPFAGCCGPVCGGMGMGMGCGPQGCTASDMPLMQPPPAPSPMPDIRTQPWAPPMPMPQGPPNPNMTMYPPTGLTQMMPMPQTPMYPNMPMYPPSGVTQATYPMAQPQYYPAYPMPQYYNPYMMPQAAPYYWYGGR